MLMEKTAILNLIVDESLASEIEKKGLAEIVTRRTNAQFSTFTKCIIARCDEKVVDKVSSYSNQLLQKNSMYSVSTGELNSILNSIDKGILKSHGRISDISNQLKDLSTSVDSLHIDTNALMKSTHLLTGINLANLAVNVSGFVIIGYKMNELQVAINRNTQLIMDLKVIEQNKLISRFESLIHRYNSFADKIKRSESINYDSLDNLLSDMHTFCGGLINNIVLKTMDTDLLLKLLFSMIPAYTCLFSEYLIISKYEKGMIPTNYESYLSIYDRLISPQLCDVLHDFYYFDLNYSNRDTIINQNIQNLLVINNLTELLDLVKMIETLDKKQFEQIDEITKTIALRTIEPELPNLSLMTGISQEECLALIKK